MKCTNILTAILVGTTCAIAAAQAPTIDRDGTCDASAVAMLDSQRIIIASDEDNILRVYKIGEPGGPIEELNLDKFLMTEAKHPEADIEAAARVGDRIYFITSHGCNRAGEQRPGRQRFFAIDIKGLGVKGPKGEPKLTTVGKAYQHLLDALTADSQLAKYDFKSGANLSTEKTGALNIEGLSAMPDGGVMIGFRSPLHEGKAILLPMTNPDKVIEGKRPTFAAPIELDLGGRGTRGIEYWPTRKKYVILAGAATDEDKSFAIYLWSGVKDEPPTPIEIDFGDLHPESVAIDLDTESLLIVSDDGSRELLGQNCKDLPAAQRLFRTVRMAIEE